MKSPKQAIFSGSSLKGTTGWKKYCIELRRGVLEDLKNGIGMKTVLDTHGVSDRR